MPVTSVMTTAQPYRKIFACLSSARIFSYRPTFFISLHITVLQFSCLYASKATKCTVQPVVRLSIDPSFFKKRNRRDIRRCAAANVRKAQTRTSDGRMVQLLVRRHFERRWVFQQLTSLLNDHSRSPSLSVHLWELCEGRRMQSSSWDSTDFNTGRVFAFLGSERATEPAGGR